MDFFRFVVPRIARRDLGRMAGITLVGALVAGLYGVLHDQVTYTISEEYFTRFKFYQFAYAEPESRSPGVFAGIIGFLATWWVGAIIAWSMARVSLLQGCKLPSLRDFASAFVIVFSVSFLIACLGYLYGQWRRRTGYGSGWLEWMDAMTVQDFDAFMTAGYIHNSSYLGGVVGTLVAIIFLRSRRQKRDPGVPAVVR
ncbi:MAG: hypothetical protein P1U81_10800 [Verrucomicrobiales bacterium]|nr:hypothetical protein [Verrucomicrobiales bacterium]